jgi:hypothetical protein
MRHADASPDMTLTAAPHCAQSDQVTFSVIAQGSVMVSDVSASGSSLEIGFIFLRAARLEGTQQSPTFTFSAR